MVLLRSALRPACVFTSQVVGGVGSICINQIKQPPVWVAVLFGGANRTRTYDPIDVNDVLYQLSQSTGNEKYYVEGVTGGAVKG